MSICCNIILNINLSHFANRSKSCKKDLWAQINTTLQSSSKWQRLDSVCSELVTSSTVVPSSTSSAQPSTSKQPSQQPNTQQSSLPHHHHHQSQQQQPLPPQHSSIVSSVHRHAVPPPQLPSHHMNVITAPIVMDISNFTVNCIAQSAAPPPPPPSQANWLLVVRRLR